MIFVTLRTMSPHLPQVPKTIIQGPRVEHQVVNVFSFGPFREVQMSNHSGERRSITPRDLAYGYEHSLENHILHTAQVLIDDASNLRDQAVEYLSIYRSRDLPAINLGIIVRVREDTLGPRAEWVRFEGKSRKRNGRRFTPTVPIKQRSRYQFSSKIFQKFPEDIRDHLIEIEQKLSIIRFRTERLAAFRDLCRQKSTYLPKE